MVTERFSWYSSKIHTENEDIAKIQAIRNTDKYKRTSWVRKLNDNYDIVNSASNKNKLELIRHEKQLTAQMIEGNSYLKRNAYAMGKAKEYEAFLDKEEAREIGAKSQLETVASTPRLAYPHIRQPMWIGDTIEHTGRNPHRARAVGNFSSVPEQGRIETVEDLINMTQNHSTKKGRTSIAFTETLGEIGRIVGYVTKAAVLALAVAGLARKAYAPTPPFPEKPAYSISLVNQRDIYSDVEVPNLKLVEKDTKTNPIRTIVENVKSAAIEANRSYSPKIETNLSVVKPQTKPRISLEQRTSPLHIDKVFAMMHPTNAIAISEYLARERAKPSPIAEIIGVSYETKPLPTVVQKPAIPDSFWEVRTPTRQVAYFNAGNSKKISAVPDSNQTIDKQIANSEFIDSNWFAQVKIKAKRMEMVSQRITKEDLTERIKSIEERESYKFD